MAQGNTAPVQLAGSFMPTVEGTFAQRLGGDRAGGLGALSARLLKC